MQLVKCFECEFQTNDKNKYRAHRGEHKSGAIAKKVPMRPTSIGPMKMPEELAGTLLPKSDKKPKKKEEPKEQPKKPVDKRIPPKIKMEAPKLQYKYEGICTVCATPVDTIVLDDVAGKDKVAVVAWCPGCKGKNRQRITHKL